MKFIAHRGNIYGPNPEKENNPDYILDAVSKGYDVEVDVWYNDGAFSLGHDAPQYKVDSSFLYNSSFWCHAKNLEALQKMIRLNIHCFWHQEDDFTVTTQGYIWTYPGKKIGINSISVMPEWASYSTEELHTTYGICTDYIDKYQELLGKK